MALLFCDNFENWTSTNRDYPGPWTTADGSWDSDAVRANVNSSIPGVFQSPGATAPSATSGLLSLAFPNTSEAVINTRIAFGHSNINAAPFIWFLDGATIQCSLHLNLNNRLALWRGLTTAQLVESTSTYSIDPLLYHDIELKLNIHNTTGSAVLKVNGIEEFNISDINTRAGSNNYSNVVRVGKQTALQWYRIFVKHFILMDTTGSEMNDFIGPVDVTSLRPNADDSTILDWTANTGTRWQAVNQAITDGDTTFVSASSPGDQILFELTNLPAGVTDVFAVMPQCQIKREQGTTRITKFLMGSGVDTELGSKELAIGPTYAFRQEAISVSPFTTDPWDVAEVNGLRLGMEITT
jgi:hypothetical protein